MGIVKLYGTAPVQRAHGTVKGTQVREVQMFVDVPMVEEVANIMHMPNLETVENVVAVDNECVQYAYEYNNQPRGID